MAHRLDLLARLGRALVELLTNLEAHVLAKLMSLRRKLLLGSGDELLALLLHFCDRPTGTTARLLGRHSTAPFVECLREFPTDRKTNLSVNTRRRATSCG